MIARNPWIAPAAALLLSLGVIFGMMSMHWAAILESLKPAEVEEHFDPVTPVYWDRYFTHLYDLQKELQEERNGLDARKEALDALKDQLDHREQELTERSAALHLARSDIRKWFVTYGQAEKANYQRIAKTYAAMEPDKVVPILMATPSEEVAKVLLEMKPDTVAPIWTAILDASSKTDANASRVSRLIELMGRVHSELKDPPGESVPAPPKTDGSTAKKGGEPDKDHFSEEEIANHRRVARTYEVMAPDKVAPILLATSTRDAAGVLLQMRPENVADIWSAIIEASRKREGSTERVAAMAEVMRRNRNGV